MQILLHKIKSCSPPDLYAIIKSYLFQRTFRVKFGEVVTQLKDINSGVPQGSMLGPLLYLLYTTDLPIAPDTITATYADDTAILTAQDHVLRSIPALTKKPIPHPDMAKKMENQSQWGKIYTGDFHHPQKDVPTSFLGRREYPSSREREIFGTTL